MHVRGLRSGTMPAASGRAFWSSRNELDSTSIRKDLRCRSPTSRAFDGKSFFRKVSKVGGAQKNRRRPEAIPNTNTTAAHTRRRLLDALLVEALAPDGQRKLEAAE
jgi:hypothetical protein